MVRLTKKQRLALFTVFKRDHPDYITPFKRYGRYRCSYCGSELGARAHIVSSQLYRRFRKTVEPLLGGNGCVMLPWKGMWLGIESDGYTHS